MFFSFSVYHGNCVNSPHKIALQILLVFSFFAFLIESFAKNFAEHSNAPFLKLKIVLSKIYCTLFFHLYLLYTQINVMCFCIKFLCTFHITFGYPPMVLCWFRIRNDTKVQKKLESMQFSENFYPSFQKKSVLHSKQNRFGEVTVFSRIVWSVYFQQHTGWFGVP